MQHICVQYCTALYAHAISWGMAIVLCLPARQLVLNHIVSSCFVRGHLKMRSDYENCVMLNSLCVVPRVNRVLCHERSNVVLCCVD